MKNTCRILLVSINFLILCVSHISVFGQNLQGNRFVNEENSWKVINTPEENPLIITSSYSNEKDNYYQTGMVWDYHDYAAQMQLTGELLHNGKSYQSFEGGCSCTLAEAIREEDMKIYYLLNGEEHLLYDLNWIPGDTNYIFNPLYAFQSVDSIQLVILTEGTFEQHGTSFKTLEIAVTIIDSLSGFELYYTTQIIEKIGGKHCFFPDDGLCEFVGGLRCFDDNENVFSFVEGSCINVGTEDLKEHPVVKIYPNPSNNHITISQIKNDNHHSISILNSEGKEVLTLKPLSSSEVIQIDHLPTGLYFVYLREENTGYSSFQKIIKN